MAAAAEATSPPLVFVRFKPQSKKTTRRLKISLLRESEREKNSSQSFPMSMSRMMQPRKKKSGSSNQQYFHSEEVLNSSRFFLVGRGGHGNFHKGNRAVRSLVADHANEYVETARKDRAQISIGLFDNHPLFQTLLFVTPRDYVLPRLEKDEEALAAKQAQKPKAVQGITLPNGTTIPPTLSSQKRWLSRTRMQSIIEEHGSISNIRSYPKGVYIEVGRDWAIDIIDHLCREQAHEIRKTHRNGVQPEPVSKTEREAGPPQSSEYSVVTPPEVGGVGMTTNVTKEHGTTGNTTSLPYPPTTSNPSENGRPRTEKIEMDRARVFASPDMMEAVEGLSALMKSEGSNESSAKPREDTPADGFSDGGPPGSPPSTSNRNEVFATGGEIVSRFPNDMHFVCGCVGFSVLDNHTFLKLIEAYFQEQIETNPKFRAEWEDKLQKLKVRRHVSPIIVRAQKYAVSVGKRQFRLWTAQREDANRGRLQRLSEEVWSQSKLVDITGNTPLLKQRLESPLRSILMTLKRLPSHTKEGNGVAGSERTQLQDSGQSTCSGSEAEERAPEVLLSSSTDAIVEAESSTTISRKRPAPSEAHSSSSTTATPALTSSTNTSSSTSKSTASQKDWRFLLPALNSSIGMELGEPPSGWFFCRERTLKLLMNSTKVSVVVSKQQNKSQGTTEDQFVWDVAKRWRKELPAKRYVCWFDARSESALCADFERYTRGIRHESAVTEKKAKKDIVEAVLDFYHVLAQTRSGAEFFLVFCSAPDPTTFASWVLPKYWYDEQGNLLQDIFSSIVIVPQQNSPYMWNTDAFRQISIRTIHRIPDKRWKDEKPWWCDLPLPNLPPMFSAEINANVMSKVRQALEMDGSLVALLNGKMGDQNLPSAVANQFVRKWMMEDPSTRFGLWLSARSEETLRKSYIKAICTLTRLDGFDDETVEDASLSPKWLAKELMELLMQMRKFAPKFQWVIVFSDIPLGSRFEEWFFPSESEWWNSRGRFAFTSSEKEDLEVTVGEDGTDSLRKVPVVNVSNVQ